MQVSKYVAWKVRKEAFGNKFLIAMFLFQNIPAFFAVRLEFLRIISEVKPGERIYSGFWQSP